MNIMLKTKEIIILQKENTRYSSGGLFSFSIIVYFSKDNKHKIDFENEKDRDEMFQTLSSLMSKNTVTINEMVINLEKVINIEKSDTFPRIKFSFETSSVYAGFETTTEQDEAYQFITEKVKEFYTIKQLEEGVICF